MTLDEKIRSINREDMSLLISAGIRSNVFLGNEIETIRKLSYRVAKMELPEYLMTSQFTLAILSVLPHLTRTEVEQSSPRDAMKFILWLRDEVEVIRKLERDYLHSEPDAEMLRAGVNDLNELGEYNTIDYLAQGKIWLWNEIESMPYEIIFTKLRKTHIENKIQKKRKQHESSKVLRKSGR